MVKTLYTGTYSIKDYVKETMWKGDLEVVQYLNTRYFDRFQQSSVLGDLPQNRNRIFKRLYTVHGSKGDHQDELLFEALNGLSQEDERKLRRGIVEALISRFGQGGSSVKSFDERDVLVDIPRDNLSTGGQIYIVKERTGETVPLERISKVYEGITVEYEKLTKRARLFLSPSLAKVLPEDYRSAERQTIYGIIKEVLEGVQRHVNQVK